MQTNLYFEHKNPADDHSPVVYPPDWKNAWGDLPTDFECHRLEAGDAISVWLSDDDIDGELEFTLEVTRTCVNINTDNSCSQDVWVKDR